MLNRVFCPKHKEKTPSCVIYDQYAYCYGGCGRVEFSELDGEVVPSIRPEPVNLEAELEHIALLPVGRIRGLDLPIDSSHYYIVWPSNDYYKKRRIFDDGGSKYLCPTGHKKPLYVPRVIKDSTTLAIVEGELNALSIAYLNPNFSVCSPGGVGDFNRKILDKNASFFLSYTKYLVIVDRDAVGVEAGIKLKEELIGHTPYVDIIAMSVDANELLQDGRLGEEVKSWGVGL